MNINAFRNIRYAFYLLQHIGCCNARVIGTTETHWVIAYDSVTGKVESSTILKTDSRDI